MAKIAKTLAPEIETPETEETYPIVYNMWITIENQSGGIVNIDQSGRPPNPQPPPTGG